MYTQYNDKNNWRQFRSAKTPIRREGSRSGSGEPYQKPREPAVILFLPDDTAFNVAAVSHAIL